MTPLAPEIAVGEEAEDAVAYRLPKRPVAGLGCAGIFLVLFGLGFAAFAAFWIVSAASLGGDGHVDWLRVSFSLFGIPFLFVGLSLVGVGVLVAGGRTEVRLADGWLATAERCGPVRWRRRRRASAVRKLVLMRAEVMTTAKRPAPFSAFRAACEPGKPMTLAFGYPPDWLQGIADDLSRRLNIVAEHTADDPVPVTVAEEVLPAAGAVPAFVERGAAAGYRHPVRRVRRRGDAGSAGARLPARHVRPRLLRPGLARHRGPGHGDLRCGRPGGRGD